tara:strand:- start:115 stop:2262 length:2148 start_codon:yes stop_codon:yes gene_type:complete
MSTQIKMRRGTTSQHSSFTGAEGEVTIDTDKEVAVVHNGSTAGGFPLARADQVFGPTGGTISSANKVNFRDSAIFINSSTDGQLDIVADTEIQIAATTIDINGAINASGEIIAASLDISGNVDIDGTTNLDVVDVDGAANFAADVTFATGADIITASAGTSNFRAGVNAGNSIASGGNYNTVVGDEAGTAISTGDVNTFVGYQSGDATTTSGNNVGVGYGSLTTNILSSKNVAVGNNALKTHNLASAGDSYNIAIGHNASENETTGIENTMVGAFAGGLGTLASRSVGIGYSALYRQNPSSAVDTYNIAIGYNTGSNVTTGTNHTLIGGLAGDAISTASNNTAVGSSALTAATTSHSNTAIGVQALQGLTTTNNSNFSTAVGFQAAYTTTHNVDAFGSKALYSNTTAIFCCAFGRDSLTTNTTGNNNSGFGYRALRLNTTGADNTAVGYSANAASTTGAGNSSVGYNALTSCTTGVRNVAMGKSALVAMTTGYDNTFIGEKAGEVLTTGFHNTAIGQYALSAGQSMEKNVAIGHLAGFTVTGDQNTFLGTNAGFNNVTSGDNNTMVGYFALSSGATVSNEFTLGNSSTNNLRCADTSISSLSDERDKKNIVDVPLGLDFIKTLRPVSFDWNARDGSRVGKKDFGFVAQELKTAGDATDYADHMRLVGTGELNLDSGKVEMLEADPMKTYPVLVKAVQELSTALNAALARIATLEG